MTFKRFSTSCLIVALTVSYPMQAKAKSVADSMESFWQDAGGAYSNGTDAQSYQIQGAGY
jgi:hypothetical protein